MESASLSERLTQPGRAIARLREVPLGTLERTGLGAMVVLAVAGFFLYPTYSNYDSLYSLLWGREAVAFDSLSFEAFRAPTEHPAAIALGGVLSPLGEAADRVLVLLSILSFVALLAGVYRLGRLAFTPLIGLLAAAILLTRFDFPYLAIRGYIDIPYLAIVIWAAVLEYERPRRGLVVFGMLIVASLMRPEAWVLAGCYFLWMAFGYPIQERMARREPDRDRGRPDPGRTAPDWLATLTRGEPSWPGRFIYAALAAAGPLIWAMVDYVVTGDPLFSLHSTGDLASELGRQRSFGAVPGALADYLGELAKPPVMVGGAIGLLLGIWFVPTRVVMPAILLFSGIGTFVAVGLAGLSLIDRYLIVATVALCIFAGLALGGFTLLEKRTSSRRIWAAGAGIVVIFGAIFTATHAASVENFNRELLFRGDSRASLEHVLASRPVRDARARGCGPISVSTHKLIPDVRFLLDLPDGAVVSRDRDVRSARAERGIAIYAHGRRTLEREGFATGIKPLTQVPPASFRLAARSRYHSVYIKCP